MIIGLITALLQGTVSAGTTLVYATLGGIVSARVGVNNFGLEGMMLMGAAIGYATTIRTGSPWAGFASALAVGAIVGLAYAVVVIALRGNQIVTGVAIIGLGGGLSAYFGRAYVGRMLKVGFPPVPIPLLSDIPVLGPALFRQNMLVYLSYLLVPLLWLFIFRSRPGLNMRAVSENPAAADGVGINVTALRYVYTVLGSALATAGGAYLSLAYLRLWLEGVTAGRGWIAIALVVFAGWNPVGALIGSYMFGLVDVATMRVQAAGLPISPFILGTLPYLFTIVVIIITTIVRGRSSGPAALGQVYDRESR